MTKTEHRISSAYYHPQTNGLVERFNQTLQHSLVKVVKENQTDWDEKLDGVLFAYRTSKQKSTKLSPFELMHCRYIWLYVVVFVLRVCAIMRFILFHSYRKAVLPIEIEVSVSDSECEDVPNLDEYTEQLNKLRDELFTKAKENIKAAR